MSSHSISASVIYKNERRREAGSRTKSIARGVIRKGKSSSRYADSKKQEMGKMKRAQVQLVDEFSMQKRRENHETIQQLSFPLQQMQEQMNSMNSSHVSSQPEMIPSSRSLLSRDKRLPLDTWNRSGVQENVSGNQFSSLDPPRDFPHRISSDDVRRNREAALGDPR